MYKFLHMQEKRRINFAPIRGRVYKYLQIKGIKHVDFLRETGLSDATFKTQSAKSELGGEALVSILKHYPSISPQWLLMGEGPMERTEHASSIQIQKNRVIGGNNVVSQGASTASICTKSDDSDSNYLKEELILELRNQIEYLKEELKRKDAIIMHFINAQISSPKES